MLRVGNCLVPVAIAGALILGCDRSSRPKMQVYPVSGKLTVAGKPVQGLVVTLTPKTPLPDSRFVPAGIVGPDGSFTIKTYTAGDGAPPGEYAVVVGVVVEMSPTAPRMSDQVLQILKKYEPSAPGGAAIGQKPVAEIVVKEQPNVIEPIDLN